MIHLDEKENGRMLITFPAEVKEEKEKGFFSLAPAVVDKRVAGARRPEVMHF